MVRVLPPEPFSPVSTSSDTAAHRPITSIPRWLEEAVIFRGQQGFYELLGNVLEEQRAALLLAELADQVTLAGVNPHGRLQFYIPKVSHPAGIGAEVKVNAREKATKPQKVQNSDRRIRKCVESHLSLYKTVACITFDQGGAAFGNYMLFLVWIYFRLCYILSILMYRCIKQPKLVILIGKKLLGLIGKRKATPVLGLDISSTTVKLLELSYPGIVTA